MPGGKQENIQNVTNQTAGVVPPPPKKVVQPAGGNIFDELKKTVEEKKKRQKSSPNAPEAVKEGQKGGQPAAANDGKPTVKKQGPPLPPRNSQSSGGNIFDELKKSVAARKEKIEKSSPNLSGAANKEQPAAKNLEKSSTNALGVAKKEQPAVAKQETAKKKTSTSSTSSSKSVSDDLMDPKADNGNDVKTTIKNRLKTSYQGLAHLITGAPKEGSDSTTPEVKLKMIYGEQGGLMTIYKLENTETKKKSGSAYGKYSLKISNSYKKLIKIDKDSKGYAEKYESFVDESGKLAVKYLSSEGKTKAKRLKKAMDPKKKEMKGRDLVIDAYKLLFMCIVAAYSANQKYVTSGKDFYTKHKETLGHFIGQ